MAPAALVGLPAAARRLGLHRATLNEMVHAGRIRATRIGPHWFITEADLTSFASSYRRPPNAPPRASREPQPAPEVLRTLGEWGEATVAELAVVVGLHEGNIRKHLALAQARGLAIRDAAGRWRPIPAIPV